MTARILVVEDEVKLANILARYLESRSHHVTVLHDGSAVLATIAREQIEIVLLDWLLPGVDGLTLCRTISAMGSVSVIMMTAKVDEADRIAGLDSGAADYICKPFSLSEVAARVRALLRMVRRLPRPTPASEGLHLDDTAHRAFANGRELDLTLVEYRLLKRLHSVPGRVFSRDELLDDIYEDNRVVNDRTVDAHIKNLRHKLLGCGLENVIATVYGIGYRWQDPARDD